MPLPDELRPFYRTLPEDATILIGLSGGADSVALLELSSRLLSQQKIIALHLNHKLRGEASEADQEFCRRLCENKNIELICKELDIAVIAKSTQKNLEEAARDERRLFFWQTAQDYDNPILLLAHHYDDQIETVLMRLMRGAGWRGLAGISSESVIPPLHTKLDDSSGKPLRLCRPLLGVTRRQLQGFLSDNNLSWREDESNADITIMRNRIRNKLLPALQIAMPGSAQRLHEFSVLGRKVEQRIDALAGGIEYSYEYGGIFFREDAFVGVEHQVCVRAIENAVVTHLNASPLRASSYGNIGSIIDGTRSAADLAAGYYMRRESDGFFIFHQLRNETLGGRIEVRREGLSITFSSAYATITSQPEILEAGNIPRQVFTEYINPAVVVGELNVRAPRAGERIALKHGSKKISDIFTDNKIPQRKRECALVLADADNILWLAPFRLAAHAFLPPLAGDSFKVSFSLK